jgi:hypothetical protein
MPEPSVVDQYRQEAARLRHEAELAVNEPFCEKIMAVARQLEELAAAAERASQ